MMTDQALYSDLPVPPGKYLEEVIGELGMTKDELAKRMNRPAPKLSAIFKGEKAITADTALQLEKVVGVPAHIWAGLEADYRLALARRQQEEEEQRLNEESHLLTLFRYASLVKLGVVARKTRPVEKVLELQKFFGVASLRTVAGLRRYESAFRTGKDGKRKGVPEAVAAWLRIGELQAQTQRCTPFREDKLRQALDHIRVMTRQAPESFQNDLHPLLADAGVALVLCPHLPGTYAHGATFWIGRDKAVVMMTLRYRWADIFWFSLFHEIGHILLHGRHAFILEGPRGKPKEDHQEAQADQFAADTLIPPSSYEGFIKAGRFYKEDIKRLADQLCISAGVVVGRLQNDGYLDPSWQNTLRTRFEWKQSG